MVIAANHLWRSNLNIFQWKSLAKTTLCASWPHSLYTRDWPTDISVHRYYWLIFDLLNIRISTDIFTVILVCILTAQNSSWLRKDFRIFMKFVQQDFSCLVNITFLCNFRSKGPSIKDVRGQGGFCPVRTFFGEERRGLLPRTSEFLDQKTSDFLKFMVCPHGQGGLSHCGQGGWGQFFSLFCGRLLWTVHKGTCIDLYYRYF